MDGKNLLKDVDEKALKPLGGGLMLLAVLAFFSAGTAGFVYGVGLLSGGERMALGGVLLGAGIVTWIGSVVLCCGFHILCPNEALVLTLFGKYYGTIKEDGWFYTNPFACGYNPTADKAALNAAAGNSINLNLNFSKKISVKTMTLNNDKQKVNDALGNPVIIGSIVIWRVAEPTKAVFNVENFKTYLSIQCDSVIRNVARLYPYDIIETDDNEDEKTLRGSSQEIAERMCRELQERVAGAGLEIQEVRITNLAYSDEIAAAMLQRQQAVAIIAARQKIVEGAVGMVKMAIEQLGDEEIVELDEERKAAMVSNLLVVLCGNKDAQPIVNSGSIY